MLEGHCFDLAETPPYGPWIDLFARYRHRPRSPPLPDAFAERGTVGAVASQMALFVQVQDFLAALATRRPVVLLLDDLHWADPASLDLLRFLARSVAALPLLLLVTYRSDELTRRHPLYALLPQLAREAGAERIDLGRLDDDAVRALVGERYGLPDADAARLVAYLQAAGGGQRPLRRRTAPLARRGGRAARDGDGWRLGDLAATAVPALLRQVIDGRLARLDEEAQRLLAVAAVIGHEVPLDRLGGGRRGGRGRAARRRSSSADEARLLDRGAGRRAGALRPRADPRGALRGDTGHRGGGASTGGWARRWRRCPRSRPGRGGVPLPAGGRRRARRSGSPRRGSGHERPTRG